MDSNVIVQAVNARGCEVLGKGSREIIQHLGCTVLECARARLPERCGKTIHCSGCVIRRSVTKTYQTGEPQAGVPATVSRSSSDHPAAVALAITTVKAGDVVILRVDRME